MTDLKPCAGCGTPTSGMCWADCGMSLCGAPLCADCRHVDEKYCWRHEPDNAVLRALKASGIRVKPLEWEEPCKANNYTHLALSIFGEYYVHVDGGRHQAWLEANAKPYENLIGAEVGHLWDAQAAAQADYEARILAALDVAPGALKARA